MKKTVNLGDKLHLAVKIEAAKCNTTIEAYIASILWAKLGANIVSNKAAQHG